MRLKRSLLALGAIFAGTNPVLAQIGAWNSESISRLLARKPSTEYWGAAQG